MRILFLNHNVVGTGTFQRAYHFGRALARRGHQVVVVTTSRTARIRSRANREGLLTVLETPDLLWGRARTGWDPWNAMRRFQLLRHARFDLIHAFDCRPAVILPALALQRRSGAPLFMDWADWWGRGGRIHDRSGWLMRTAFGPIETWFEEAFRTRALGTTVISSALGRRSRSLGVEPQAVLCIANGCDPETITPIERGAARASLGLGAAGPLLAYLGTATRGEMRLACDTLRVLRARAGDARLVFVGDPKVPIPRDLLRAGSVRRTGFIPFSEMRLWLGAADLGLIAMPDTLGHRGRWPGKLSEYLSAGRPVLMTDVGDAAELVVREGIGWTAAADASALAAAAQQALSDDAAWECAATAARTLAERDLSWDRLAEVLERFYRERLAGWHGRVTG